MRNYHIDTYQALFLVYKHLTTSIFNSIKEGLLTIGTKLSYQ